MKSVKSFFKVLIFVFVIFLAVADYYVYVHFIKNKEEVKIEEKVEDKQEEVNITKDDKKEVSLTLLGDFLYEKPYLDSLDYGDDISLYFSKIKDKVSKSDITIGTLGLPISDDTSRNMKMPRIVTEQALTLDLDVISLSTNHSNDLGESGRKESLTYFKGKNILPIGVYEKDKRDVSKNIINKNGIKIGFLSYTYGTNVLLDKENYDEVSLYMDPSSMSITNELKTKITKEVEELKKSTDLLVVMMYWGSEYTYNISPDQEEMVKLLNSLGVDIIVGTHSHNMQKIEWYENSGNKTLVYYSLGNFVSADNKVNLASDEMTKSYQIGLISNLKVTKENNKVEITTVNTEPIINYYDKDLRNFYVVPYSLYDETLETSHNLYSSGFTKKFVEETYNKVINENFRG